MRNADYAVDWNEVEQVVRCDMAGRSIAQPACPICLDHPSPAKVTRCGHVYWCVRGVCCLTRTCCFVSRQRAAGVQLRA